MSDDARTLLANLRRQREQLAKSKLPAAEKAKLQRALDLAGADAQTLVTLREALSKGIEDYKAKSKALAAGLKALHAKFNATAEHRSQALKALGEARKAGKDAEAEVAGVLRAFQDLNMNLLDFSPYQDIDGA